MASLRPEGVFSALSRAGGVGMADVIFVAIGVGAFVAFAALAIALKRL